MLKGDEMSRLDLHFEVIEHPTDAHPKTNIAPNLKRTILLI